MSGPLPATGYLSSNSRETGDMQAASELFNSVCKELIGAAPESSTLSITSNLITPPNNACVLPVDASGGGTINTIDITNIRDGQVIYIHSVNPSNPITIANLASGSGTSIATFTGQNIVLSNPAMFVSLKYNASLSQFQEIFPSATVLPHWTTLGRPSSPFTGQTGLNTNLGVVESWNGSSWLSTIPNRDTTSTVVGTGALAAQSPAGAQYNNTAIGVNALNANTSGYSNTVIGSRAAESSLTGNNNIAIGFQAYEASTANTHNIAIGNYSLYGSAVGSYNVAIGEGCLGSAGSIGSNTAIGAYAMSAGAGYYNTAVGSSALTNSNGSNNAAVGINCLSALTSANGCTAVGANAGMTNTTEVLTAVGFQALGQNTSGSSLDAFGYSALYNNTEGYANSAFGINSLSTNTDGYNNVAIGCNSIMHNTHGYQNTGVGAYVLNANTTGHDNTGIGKSSLSVVSTGSSNTGVGSGVGQTLTTGSHNILIGNSADVPASSTSNFLNIGNAVYGTGILGGTVQIGINQASPAYTLDVNGTLGIAAPLHTTGAPSGAKIAGTATLSSGTVTVNTTAISSTSLVLLTHKGTGTVANFGTLYLGTVTAATSFVINSTNGSDNDDVTWFVIEP